MPQILPPCRWVDHRRASPLWVDRGRGLLDFVVGSSVDEFAVGLCWLLWWVRVCRLVKNMGFVSLWWWIVAGGRSMDSFAMDWL